MRRKLDNDIDDRTLSEGGSDEGRAPAALQRSEPSPDCFKRLEEENSITRTNQGHFENLRTNARLPPEILGEIFRLLQVENATQSFRLPLELPMNLRNANAWIVVCHVCQHWRMVARKNKSLWRRITLSNLLSSPADLARTFFNLSDPLPVEFEHQVGSVAEENHRMNAFYDTLIQHPNRIAALYLRGDFPDNAWRLLQMPLPNITAVQAFFESWHMRHIGTRAQLELSGSC
ncbi:hypothetical protein NLJ89_g4438 [Agrocybe chaxingu]|uniref:F-box domain-containing protein n=1 Tax=Agrocybe chaxingu TaxID=84603 RepID=A0A9W8MUJ8_9AGAR|nr:hypothetical protein NLJ89_g4438 [Agrocybe chaxingu]